MITDLRVYTLHDALPTFFDINGQPIIGRLKFFEADGTTFKPIYSSQDYTTELPNPLLTNLAGRPEAQPFLKNGLYRVVLEKYIGDNLDDMADYQYEHEDPEHLGEVSHWKFEKEFLIDSGLIDSDNTEVQYMATVDTIAELRTLSYTEYKYATVIDYDENVKGIAPRTYVWNANSVRPEDYGSTIISSLSDSGRWELLESSIMESTTFGVSPYVESGVLQSRLNGLANYSMSASRKAQVIYWKPGVYVLDNGMNISIGLPVVCYGNLKFMTPEGTSRVSFQGGIEFPRHTALNDENTTLVINQETVRASWFAGSTLSFNGDSVSFDTIIADNTEATSQSFVNLNVIVENTQQVMTCRNCNIRLDKDVYASGSTFYDCRFDQGIGRFRTSGHTFEGSMTIHPWMFYTGISMASIKIGPSIYYSCAEWGAQKYCELKLIQDDHHIGSIDEGKINITLDTASVDANDVYVIENGSGVIDLSNLYVNLELHNFSGTLRNVANPSTINLIDCWVTLEGNPTVASLALRRGDIYSESGVQAHNSLYLEDVNVRTTFDTMDISPEYVRCTISAAQYNYLEPVYRNCRILSVIDLYPGEFNHPTLGVGQFMNGTFVGNTFENGSYVRLRPRAGVDYSSTLVGIRGKYINNVSDHAFIIDTSWENVAIGSKTYKELVYEGNYGGCPVKKKQISVAHYNYSLLDTGNEGNY